MTVSSQTPLASSTANGVATTFPYAFTVLQAADLVVIGTLSGVTTTYVNGVDYTITGLGATSGSVVFSVAPANGTVVVRYRKTAVQRTTDYQNNGDLLAAVVNLDFDRIWLTLQEMIQGARGTATAVRAPDGYELDPLPGDPSQFTGYYIGMGATGPVYQLAPTGTAAALASDLLSTSNASKGGALVGLSPSALYAEGTLGRAVQEMYGTIAVTYYVATTGSDANNGLTVGAPFATLQKAFDVLMSRGVVGGTKRIILAAGTYSSASNRAARIGPANEVEAGDPDVDPYQTGGVLSVNYIIIQGPDVGYDPTTLPRPVPTAILDGGSASAIGIQIEGPIKVLVKDIKFQNYSGSTSSAGISGDGARLRCENIHTDNCQNGIISYQGKLEVRGGNIYGNAGKLYLGIRSMFNNKHEIGNQGALGAGQGPLIRFCSIGVLAQEMSTGHCDSVSFEDNIDAVRATVNSRVNYSYSNFKRNTRAIRADAGSAIFGETTAVFNIGTADANTENIVLQQGATDIDRDTYSNGCVASDYIMSDVVHTGTLVSTPMLSKTLKRGRFAPVTGGVRMPQTIKCRAYGSFTGTAGTKQFKLRIGATNVATITNAAADTGDWWIEAEIEFRGTAVQRGAITYNTHLSTTRVNVGTAVEDMNASDKVLAFEVQLGNIADTVTVRSAHFEVMG